MREEKRQQRHQTIVAAAYGLLEKQGYGGTSMLAVAKAAKASNETMYRWYGDKQGLFRVMVEDNAAAIKAMLEAAIAEDDPPMETLGKLAPVLLKMLLGPRAVVLNRAAAADASGTLGTAISVGGRDVIVPLVAQVIAQIVPKDQTAEAAQWYVGLVIGDLQIKRAIGVIPELTDAQIKQRCDDAMAAFTRLVAA